MSLSICLQVRQLLLDPAVNHEFERILKALEDKTAEAKRLHEELKATNFVYESKQGRMLVAKCRTLTVSAAHDCCSPQADKQFFCSLQRHPQALSVKFKFTQHLWK